MLTLGQDNTQYAFLQMEDRVLIYRGADQPDMSVINPESDVWQHIKVITNTDLQSILLIISKDTSRIPGICTGKHAADHVYICVGHRRLEPACAGGGNVHNKFPWRRSNLIRSSLLAHT